MILNWLRRSSGTLYRQQQLPTFSRCSSSSSLLINNNHPNNHHNNSSFRALQKSNFIAQHFSYHPHDNNINRRSFATDSSGETPLRRRRRKPSKSLNTTTDDDDTHKKSSSDTSSSTTSTSSEAFFSPRDSTTGELLTSDQYLKLASLSPWVPCPDVVSKRVFEIAANDTQSQSSSSSNENGDIHVDLGCGDGRLNFMAVDSTDNNGIKESWGVDVDENILIKCRERLERRFVPQRRRTIEGESEEEEEVSSSPSLEFVQADLVEVMKLQKEVYQRQQRRRLVDGDSAAMQSNHDKNAIDNNDNNKNAALQSITNRITNSTIITMYFVDNALQQIQPYLSSILGGKKNVRVITIGYEMPNKDGWNASWVERVLGLTIFRYEMEDVSRFPLDWSVERENDEEEEEGEDKGLGGKSNGKSMSNTDTLIDAGDDDQDVEEFLRRKREQDIEELNRGLRIHHDEELDEFAHARSKKQGMSAESGSAILGLEEDDDDEEWGDFDETEDPQELMKEAQRRIIENRKASRGKMMAGVGSERKKKKKSSTAAGTNTGATKKPTWKKP